MSVSYISQQPVNDFGLRLSDTKYSATLAATTDTTLTVPGGSPTSVKYKAVIKVTAPVWVAVNAVAAVPAGATFAATTSELIEPELEFCREVAANDVIHFFAAATASVSVVLYSLFTPN